jgi:adenylate kinase
MSVVFLTGVHGVGKGFLGAPVAQSLGMDHCTASQLIREEKGRATWGTNKRVTEIDDNQSALIRAVTQRRESGKDILLDGHFVLRGTSGEFIRLGKEVYAGLLLIGVVLLTEDSQTIADRLVSRDGIPAMPESIKEHAAEVYAHVHNVCGELNIPLIVLHSPSFTKLAAAVDMMLESSSGSHASKKLTPNVMEN